MILSSRFNEALAYAAELHAQQQRKISGEPYVSHLLGVAAIAIQYGADEDEAIAALLHDAIEDQGGATAREAIRERFGARVVQIVDGCSDTDITPKPPWRQRKEAYIEHLRHATDSMRLVSAADKLHNARAILQDYRTRGETLWEHFRGGRDGTLWYYRSIVDTLKQVKPNLLVAELDRVVLELEHLVAQNA
ncbi:MAG TPA: HD domain-containing protein [Thermoguttaceae bacterium]|nr:HD domain-containing protein [Thermoguttaceae bacterium]